MKWSVLFFMAWTAFAQQLPDGPGRDTLKKVCTGCHGPDIVVGRSHTADEWAQIVLTMVNSGATGTDQEFGEIVEYLAKYFPKSAAKINVNSAPAPELATGLELTAKEAEAIVQFREKSGSFKSIEDLKKVPGLDAKKVEAKKDRLVF